MSFNGSWKPTGLDSPVEGKVKHRSVSFTDTVAKVSQNLSLLGTIKSTVVHMSNPFYP